MMMMACTSQNAVRNLTTDCMALAFIFLKDLVCFHSSDTTLSIDNDNVTTEFWALWRVLPTAFLDAKAILLLEFLDHGQQRMQITTA
jgi:hypothetical protein